MPRLFEDKCFDKDGNMPGIAWGSETQRNLEWGIAKHFLEDAPDGTKIKKSRNGRPILYTNPNNQDGDKINLGHSFVKISGCIYAMANSSRNETVKGFNAKVKIGETEAGEVVALKVSHSSHPSLISRKEIYIAKKVGAYLGHVRVVGSGKTVMAMPHLGKDLFEYLKKNRRTLPKSELDKVALYSTLAVAKFHRAGYLHRDIKTENMTIHKKGISRAACKIIFFNSQPS